MVSRPFFLAFAFVFCQKYRGPRRYSKCSSSQRTCARYRREPWIHRTQKATNPERLSRSLEFVRGVAIDFKRIRPVHAGGRQRAQSLPSLPPSPTCPRALFSSAFSTDASEAHGAAAALSAGRAPGVASSRPVIVDCSVFRKRSAERQGKTRGRPEGKEGRLLGQAPGSSV